MLKISLSLYNFLNEVMQSSEGERGIKIWNISDLQNLAGDQTWYYLEEPQKLHRAGLRAELIVAEGHSDKLALLSGKGFSKDPALLYAVSTNSQVVNEAVLNVYESTKEHRRAEAAAVGAALKLSLDFTKQPGENVGEEWLLTIKNENGQMVAKLAGPSSNTLHSRLRRSCALIPCPV